MTEVSETCCAGPGYASPADAINAPRERIAYTICIYTGTDVKKPDYLEFCLGYARFLQRLQYRYEEGEGDVSYHGHYGFGFLSPPQAPATGGFTEGVMGALLLAEAYQTPPAELKDLYAQVLASVEALTNDQITTSSRWNIKNFIMILKILMNLKSFYIKLQQILIISFILPQLHMRSKEVI